MIRHLIACGAFAASLAVSPAADPFQPARKLVAHTYNSGFADAHDTYNGMGCASNGRIYYVLSSERHDVGAQMFSFDPQTRTIQRVADVT